MKRYHFLFMFCLLCHAAASQNEVDALRYAYTQRASTARTLAMGYSFGALGADLSSFYTNPAGTGAFKRGGVEISLGLLNLDNSATYEGTTANNGRTPFYLNSVGMVGNSKPKKKDWIDLNFGIGYAQTNNFNDNVSIKGTPFGSSLLEVFAAQASGIHPDLVTDELPFTAGLAYQVYGINPQDTAGTGYVAAAGSGEVDQMKSIRRQGSQGETSFSFGGNYRDKLLMGGSINYTSTSFYEQSVYTENYEADNDLKNIGFNETLRSNGNGIGLKLGFIVKPTTWVRAGFAVHTPVIIRFRETYSTSMSSTMADGTPREWNSPTLVTTYNLRTPARLIANAAFVLGKSGLITADYEYAAFDRMTMRGTQANQYNYETENEVISNIYRGVHRAGVGLEMRITQYFAARGGAIYQQSPFVDGVAANPSWITYTGGIGFRSDYFFCDIAGSFGTNERTYYLYQTIDNSPVSITSKRLNFLMSVGFRY